MREVRKVERLMIDLQHGDCSALMGQLPDGLIDLIVTDPPYERADMRDTFAEMVRVLSSRGSIYVFGNKNTVAEHWFSQFPMARKELLIWHYRNSPKPRGRWRLSMQAIIYGWRDGAPFNEDEARVPYNRATLKLNGRMRPSAGRLKKAKPYDTSKGALPRDVVDCPALLGHLSAERVGHPDQKPLALIEKFIRASSNEGDLILDPFAGSGTTLVACAKTGRRAIGYELDAENFAMAKARLQKET